MKRAKFFYLSTCNTCKKILAQYPVGQVDLQEIKTAPITAEQLDFLASKVGSYEGLFSRRAVKFRSLGLAQKELSEADYRKLILEEYTFLKRPVVVVGEKVFVGSAKKNVEAALKELQ